FQVRANLVMPLLSGPDLWGLLCVHQCDQPRQWQSDEVELTRQLASQLAIAIQQSNLYQQVQRELSVRQRAEAQIAQQLRQQQALTHISRVILDSLDIDATLTTVTKQVKAV
ncbi:GAF domain-containing protein, partial [Haemophilus parainfluenzae]|uniref:GAF domain-containing protein n=1 Tax=Haemophilus parainfluenzae TaxID=729 RepID=UPI00124B8548